MQSTNSFRQVVRDVLDLCELQIELLAVNSQEARRKAVRAFVLALAAVTLAGSALTTVMLGGGFLLHELTDWPVGVSMLTIAGVTFAIVILLLVVAVLAIKSAAAAMQESKSEFIENLKWIKAVLVSPESSPRNQLRSESFATQSSSRLGSHSSLNGR